MRPLSEPSAEPAPNSGGASAPEGLRSVTGSPVVWRTVAALVVAATVTALVSLRVVEFGVNSPSGHLVLNALDAFIALLVAFLVYGRFLREQLLRDLLLSQGLFLLAVAGLGLSYLSRVLPEPTEGAFEIWLPLAVRVIGVGLLAAAALVGGRRLTLVRHHRWVLAIPLALLAGVFVVLRGFGSALPVAFDFGTVPTGEELPLLTGHPVLLVAQGVGALGFLVAAGVFTTQAARSQDELLGWLGPAFVLGGFARLNYLLFPSVYTDWLYSGDLLRTGCHLLLLVGATREIQRHWHAQADVAVLEDRRRLARELHDGVVQELSFIRSATHSLSFDGASRDSIIGACDRALDEARAAVHALGSPAGEPLSATLERAVRQLADRYDVTVSFDLAPAVTVDPEQQHALVRIAREAVHNAVRHGEARHIVVSLRGVGDSQVLTVRDDGAGFNVPQAGAVATGYGLTSMRDRAQGLPGEFRIESEPGAGSEVTVRW